jgi:hypothetical protein
MARSPIVDIAGKTGTAQVVEMKGAYVKREQLAYSAAIMPGSSPMRRCKIPSCHRRARRTWRSWRRCRGADGKKVFEKFVEQAKQQTEKQQVRLGRRTRAD